MNIKPTIIENNNANSLPIVDILLIIVNILVPKKLIKKAPH